MSAPNLRVRRINSKKIYCSLVPLEPHLHCLISSLQLTFVRGYDVWFWGYSYLSQMAEFFLWSEPWDHPMVPFPPKSTFSWSLFLCLPQTTYRRLVSKGMWLVYHAIIHHPAVWGSGAWLSQMSRGQVQYLPVSSCQIFPLWNAWNYMRRLT